MQTSPHQEYLALSADLARVEREVSSQLCKIIDETDVTLGFPLESRIKTWESLSEKAQRKGSKDGEIVKVGDLVGFRIVLLFQKDIEPIIRQIEACFDVIQKENAAERLNEAQFGYVSFHLTARIPESWQSIPTFKGLAKISFEIQVRSVAQHIWAAASHKLQYKNEASVPQQVKRALHRVSAILELVDQELNNAFENQVAFRAKINVIKDSDPLSTDIMIRIMDELLPKENKHDTEQYDTVTMEAHQAGFFTAGEIKRMITERLESALSEDRDRVLEARGMGIDGADQTVERDAKDVYFTHTGLMRIMLERRRRSRANAK
jgi:ppGpp synthetase/RelA/SpoT-type nucleotidyltranferase